MWIPSGQPEAVACLSGGPSAPELHGTVWFYQTRKGVVLVAQVCGLPQNNPSGFFAFHIHAGGDCGGEGFADTEGHLNPGNTQHPAHAGDLPPLLASSGRACLAVLTDRFRLADVIGRTVVIHSGPDDFHTQPAGNAGAKIACGVIRRNGMYSG